MSITVLLEELMKLICKILYVKMFWNMLVYGIIKDASPEHGLNTIVLSMEITRALDISNAKMGYFSLNRDKWFSCLKRKQSSSWCHRSSVLLSCRAWIWKRMELFMEQIQVGNGSSGENGYFRFIGLYKRWQLIEGLKYIDSVRKRFLEKFYFHLQKYLDLILSDEMLIKFKVSAIASMWKQKQNLNLVIDLITARHKDINDAYVLKRKIGGISL